MPMSSPQMTMIFGLSALALDLAISISFRWSGGFESAYCSRHCEDLRTAACRGGHSGGTRQSRRHDCTFPMRLLRCARNDNTSDLNDCAFARLRKAQQHGKEGEKADAGEDNGD